VLNTHTFASAPQLIETDAAAAAKALNDALLFEQESLQYMTSPGTDRVRNITDYYSSFFSLPQNHGRLLQRHHDLSRSESTEDIADLNYVIDMTRGKTLLDEIIRERSKHFRGLFRTEPAMNYDMIEHKQDEKEGEEKHSDSRRVLLFSRSRTTAGTARRTGAVRFGGASYAESNGTDSSFDDSLLSFKEDAKRD
jgi:hypothetical protein